MSKKKIEKEDILKEDILNYLNYNLGNKENLDLLDFIFTVDSYEVLGTEVPNKDEVIKYFNSIQTDEGTWDTGEIHYVPVTAQILMTYSRWGAKPVKSLKPLFKTIENWRKVVAHVKRYDPGNYWGGLWGYITCYTMQGEKPPWTREFLKEVAKEFDKWAFQNHQRTHLMTSLLQLRESLPRIEEVIKITLQQQRKDGSWGDPGWNKALPQTFFAVSLLRIAKDQIDIPVDYAINRGFEFIRQCYTVVSHEGKNYGGFTTNPNEIFPKPLETAMGIAALFNPDLYIKWIVSSDPEDSSKS